MWFVYLKQGQPKQGEGRGRADQVGRESVALLPVPLWLLQASMVTRPPCSPREGTERESSEVQLVVL